MILGIDLGTSNSMAAVYKDGQVEFIKSRTGNKIIPSVVSMDENGRFYTGDVAKERKLKYPELTVDLFKRSMGTKKPFTIGDREIMAEELSAVVLKRIKEDAEHYLGETIEDAIISVPAFFTNSQRKAVLQAGKLAGLQVKKIINEPTAAALAYGVQGTSEGRFEEKNILVLDLGGGTFDISVMEASEDVMEVVAVCGDNKLGGIDFTNRLIELFMQANDVTAELSMEEKSVLWNQAQRAKHQISNEGIGKMSCNIAGQRYEYTITEEQYEEACLDLLEKIRMLTIRTIEESRYNPDEIEEIIMVGGGTKLSIVRKLIEKLAGKPLEYKISPDEAVAMGAAMQGAMFEKKEDIKDLVMTDIAPHYLGTRIRDGGEHDLNEIYDIIIQKNVTIPTKGTVVHYSRPSYWGLRIYQMEDKYGQNSSYLGEITYSLPDVGTERVEVHKSVYYDSNGIVHLSVYIPATGVTYEKTLINEDCEMSEEEAAKRVQELKYMNIGSRENEEDLLLIAKADNIYMELVGRDRERLGNVIGAFESALNDGKRSVIANKREYLKQLLNIYNIQEY